jgi:hypothetical protein
MTLYEFCWVSGRSLRQIVDGGPNTQIILFTRETYEHMWSLTLRSLSAIDHIRMLDIHHEV